MDKRKKREQILFNLIAAAVLLLFLFPIYWMVITSLKSSKEIFAEVPTFFPEKIELERIHITVIYQRKRAYLDQFQETVLS